MTTSSPAHVSRSLRVQGALSWLRALSPRSVGIMVLSLAMLMTVATYLLYTSLTYPMILLAPAPLAQAMAAQGASGSVFGFLCLLISGGLVIVLSVRLAVDLDQPAQRRTSVIGGTAGSLW